MTDKCAACGQPATQKISGEPPVIGEFEGQRMLGHPLTNYLCDDCFDAIMSWRGFAAGPWQPMDTAPELEDVLIKVKYGDEIKVMIACRYENHWMHDYDQDRMQDDGKIVAWAAINTQEEETK